MRSKAVPAASTIPVRPSAPYHGRRALAPADRLGCSVHVLADLLVDIPAASQVHRPVVRKTVALDDLVIDPVVRLYLVDVPAPELGADRSDLHRLLDALAEQWDLRDLTTRPAVLAALQPALATGARTVTVAVHDGRALSAIWPGFVDTAYGVAIDVGSTTVAGHLCDLATGEVLASAGIMNPQIRFGEDLMSRVSYVMMHDDGAGELTATIRAGLRDVLEQLMADTNADRDHVLDVVLVGNPIMHHLVLGIDPTPLGTAPFTLATDEPIDALAGDVELGLPYAHLHVLPCIAGHVGADTAAAVLQEGPHRGEAITLLVDVGTNAEIVLGNRDRLLAASSPTGPAFEGAQLSSGQRATIGAIERVRINPETLEPRDQGDRYRPVVRRTRLRVAVGEHRRDRDLRFGCDRGDRRALPRGRDPARRHHRRGDRRPIDTRASPTTGRSPTCCTTPPAATSGSPRTTCARSSSRRRRSTPAYGS